MRCSRLGLLVLFVNMSVGVVAYGQSLAGAPDSTEMAKTPDAAPGQRSFRDGVFMRKTDPKKTSPKAQAIEEVSGLLADAQIACKVTDAALVARGAVESGGHKIDTKTYEAACDSGIGYFVVSAEKVDAFSCFAAQATRAKDIAEGRPPGIVCTLPTNAEPKAMANAALARTGRNCQVSNVRWIGLSAKASTEYTETACNDGTGYVLMSAMPGSKASVGSMTCQEAGSRGIFCTLTASGQPVVNVLTFRNELVRHNIVCSARDEDIRYVGQEATQKRYVVEFKCAEFPKGLVAYIPLGTNVVPFEGLDCTAAKRRRVQCTLQ